MAPLLRMLAVQTLSELSIRWRIAAFSLINSRIPCSSSPFGLSFARQTFPNGVSVGWLSTRRKITMLSGLYSGLRTLHVSLFLVLFVGTSFTPASVNAQAPSAVGNPNTYLKPFPAPVLPAAGGQFVDPTFGTTIVRITDPSNAPYGGGVNSVP